MALPAPVADSSARAESLWEKAFKNLGDENRQRLDAANVEKSGVLEDVLNAVKQKKDICLEKRWAVTRKNGERIILRDLCEKVLVWIDKFKEIGDTVVQYDPGHAALPWAGVRFVLQASLNDVHTFGAMAEGLERVTNLITRCKIMEGMYLKAPSYHGDDLVDALRDDLASHLGSSILCLYAAILQFLARAGHYYNKRSAKRILKSVIETPEAAVHKSEEAISAREEDVQRCLQLVTQSSLNKIFEQSKETQRLDCLLHSLDEPIRRVSTQLSKVFDLLNENERIELLKWLSTVPYRRHHNTVKAARLPGSGNWLLRKHDFIEWRKSSSSSVLWLHGIPGSGKTHLVSLVIDTFVGKEYLEEESPNVPVAYFYCNRNPAELKRSDPEEILRCILKQLCSRKPKLPVRRPVATAFKQRKMDAEIDGLDPEPLSLRECTTQMIEILAHDPAIIIIDAFDECNRNTRHQLLLALDRVVQESPSLVKIFIASRNDSDIRKKLESSMNIYIDASDNARDIEEFIQKELSDAINSGRLLGGDVSDQLKGKIQETLSAGAQGMFRLVSLQIQDICDANRFILPADVEAELGRLPQSLMKSYDGIYQRIITFPEKSKLVAHRAISWLLCAYSPLKISSFITAITYDDAFELTKEKILEICCNLVEFDETSMVFRFAHISVREYLENRAEFSPSNIRMVASCACLDTWNMSGRRRSSLPDSWKEYSAIYLTRHLEALRKADPIQHRSLKEKLGRFVDDREHGSSHFLEWRRQHDSLEQQDHHDSLDMIESFTANGFPLTMGVILWTLEETGGEFVRAALDKIFSNSRLGISEEMFGAASKNRSRESREYIAKRFFHEDPAVEVTDSLIEPWIRPENYEVIPLFISRASDLAATRELVRIARRWRGYGPYLKRFFTTPNRHLRILPETVEAMAELWDGRMFRAFIGRKDFDKEWVTEHVVRRISENTIGGGFEIMRALLEHDAGRVLSVAPLDTLVKIADAEAVELYLSIHAGPQINGDILATAAGNPIHGAGILRVLLEHGMVASGSFSADEVQRLFDVILENRAQRSSLLSQLLQNPSVSPDRAELEVGLRAAASSNDLELVLVFLDSGIDVNAADEKGVTALQIAETNWYFELSEELRTRGAQEYARPLAPLSVPVGNKPSSEVVGQAGAPNIVVSSFE